MEKFSASKYKDLFLWPRSKSISISDLFNRTSYKEVEEKLKNYWPNTYPVIFSSARSGLTAILEHSNISRPDLVCIPAYSSHCLFDSVARHATPITQENGLIKAAVIYHQWGFPFKSRWGHEVVIIEDAVDTVFKPNADIFIANGQYALQSLPKVYGTMFGGVVFCRSESDAKSLMLIREKRTGTRVQNFLRFTSKWSDVAYRYWHGAESLSGGLSTIALSQIKRELDSLPELFSSRMDLLHRITPEIACLFEGLGRAPSNIPLRVTPKIAEVWKSNCNIVSGLRNFNLALNSSNEQWELVAPLPVHSEVDEGFLALLAPTILNEGRLKSELSFF